MLASVGPAPENPADLSRWRQQVGQLAAVRDATGWDDPDIALGRAPGVSTPHKRLEWTRAWTAAGMPEEKRPAADLTDGQIRVRVAAGERVLAPAPASVHEQQRLREQQLADLTRGDVLAQAEGLGTDTDAAERQAQLTEAAEAVQRLDEANTARAHWLLAHAETLNAYDDAQSEAQSRGLVLGAEPDRATASDWLEEQRAADQAPRPATRPPTTISTTRLTTPTRTLTVSPKGLAASAVIVLDTSAIVAAAPTWDVHHRPGCRQDRGTPTSTSAETDCRGGRRAAGRRPQLGVPAARGHLRQ